MVETPRLLLKPLTHDQLVKYIQNDGSLEQELGLAATVREISPDLKDALEQMILPSVADRSKNYLFSTLWTIIVKDQNRMVGDICFYGEPNENGEVEIGYGTYAAFQGKGYMTEAVGAMVRWATRQPNVKTVLASTDKTNVGSYTVLIKNGFKKVGETDELFNWAAV